MPWPSPEGVPADTLSAVGGILAGFQSCRYPRGAWLEIIPGADPVRHGICTRAGSGPELAAGGVQVVLGEHLAQRPSAAAWVVAHEIRDPAGWAWRLYVISTTARLAAWPVAGWAVPWPWLLIALAGIQAAYTAAGWAIEISCDLAARASRDAGVPSPGSFTSGWPFVTAG
jgi:hypothetical protein